MSDIRIRNATIEDAGVILELIQALAEFEKLAHEVKATRAQLEATLFGAKPSAEVLIAEVSPESANEGAWRNAGFALFFTSYSTFLGKPGLYLEDLFIRPEFRSRGLGEKMLGELARIAVERDSGRLEWSVLDWNKRAWEFYARLGATPLTDWTVHRVAGEALKNLAEGGAR